MSLGNKVDMIGHDTECMYRKLHGIGNAFQGFDGDSAAIRVLKNGTAVFAADGDEVNFAANVLVTRKTNLLAGSNEHRGGIVAEAVVIV